MSEYNFAYSTNNWAPLPVQPPELNSQEFNYLYGYEFTNVFGYDPNSELHERDLQDILVSNNNNNNGFASANLYHSSSNHSSNGSQQSNIDFPVPREEVVVPGAGIEYSPSRSSSSGYPSQGSGFGCPASPTYAYSLPRMSQSSPSQNQNSQSSQGSGLSVSSSAAIVPTNNVGNGGIVGLQDPYYSTENFQYNFSGSESGGSQSQPEAKRMRFGQ